MPPYISQCFHDQLACHGLDTFGGLWDLPWDWIEPPNMRRKGWSGASRHDIVDARMGTLSIIVKRQENHNYRTFHSPCRGRPTFFRDFSYARRLEQIGVPTVEPVFYGERRQGDKHQAVLVTRMLEGYSDLEALFADATISAPLRTAILHRLADILQIMHRHYLFHNNMRSNHVLVRAENDDVLDLRILDLERMHRRWPRFEVAVRELEKFIRHSPALTRDEFTELVCHYARNWRATLRRMLVARINRRLTAKWRYGPNPPRVMPL